MVLAYLRRGLLLWPGARGAVAVVAMLAEQDLSAAIRTVAPPAAYAPAALLLVAALGVVDLHVRRERALLGALGIPRRTAVAFITLGGAVAELLLVSVSRLA